MKDKKPHSLHNVLDQFHLKGSQQKSKMNKKKKRPKSKHSIMLPLCIILGLIFGISSTFAQQELFPENPPLDQPSSTKGADSTPAVKDSKIVEVDEVLPDNDNPELEVNSIEENKKSAVEKKGLTSGSQMSVDTPEAQEILKATPRPRTKKGMLPDTASDDWTYILFGIGLVLSSSFALASAKGKYS